MQENPDILQKVSDRRYLKIDIPLEMLPWSSLQIKNSFLVFKTNKWIVKTLNIMYYFCGDTMK